MARKLVLMGSGENSPAMVTPHQNVLKAIDKSAKRINLDTPYGFQENADELTKKIRGYFETNVGFPIEDVLFRSINDSAPSILDEIDRATWLFSGPGSPTYALRVWSETGAEEKIGKVLDRGTVVMASAAAMTMGAKVMPVYEMYKVGDDPYWLDGLNILENATGIKATVIAHYNNNQGGTHDTRFCFAGKRRMDILESLLDAEIGILGLDEHTGVAFDLDLGTADVFGKGEVTFKSRGEEKKFLPKNTYKITEFK